MVVRREKTNYTIQSVSHAVDVLEQFSGENDELGVTELSKRLKLHKNNVFRLLATLEARGYIEQNKATENYRLGLRCLKLGQKFLSQIGVLNLARPIMAQLARKSRETAFIAVLRPNGAVPVDAVEPEQAIRLIPRVGEPLPLHCTAAGKVHLAYADDELRAALPDALQKFTDATILDRQQLLAALATVVETGVALDVGEHVVDVRSVAVPVRDYTRAVVGTLAVSGPAYRLNQERLDKELTPLVVKAGRELSTKLGFDA